MKICSIINSINATIYLSICFITICLMINNTNAIIYQNYLFQNAEFSLSKFSSDIFRAVISAIKCQITLNSNWKIFLTKYHTSKISTDKGGLYLLLLSFWVHIIICVIKMTALSHKIISDFLSKKNNRKINFTMT